MRRKNNKQTSTKLISLVKTVKEYVLLANSIISIPIKNTFLSLYKSGRATLECVLLVRKLNERDASHLLGKEEMLFVTLFI